MSLTQECCIRTLLVLILVNCQAITAQCQEPEAPTGTAPLTIDGDPASLMVDGLDRFLLRQITNESQARSEEFRLDTESTESLNASATEYRSTLASCLGIRDPRLSFSRPEIITWSGLSSIAAESENVIVQAIRWPVLSDPSPQGQGLISVAGEGLLLTPKKPVRGSVIVLPDADQTPEQMAGLQAGLPASQQVARLLAESGCRVVVPMLVSRQREKRLGRADLTHREYLHRAAFELGRTLAGYEVQSVLSLVDWFEKDAPDQPIGVYGHGEGGMEALFAAAFDTRIDATAVSGFFGPREASWQEPIDRNFSGLLKSLGAAELACLCAPRKLMVLTTDGPAFQLAGNGGAPAELASPSPLAAAEEFRKAQSKLGRFGENLTLVQPEERVVNPEILSAWLTQLTGVAMSTANEPLTVHDPIVSVIQEGREKRVIQQLDRHNQLLLRESPFVRKEFMSKLDVTSVEAYTQSSESYRDVFRKSVIGEFQIPVLPFNARSRRSYETDKWVGYEVMLDVFPDVFAYGILLLPRDLKPGEKRPVVVCQHGLEGRPADIIQGDHPAYHDFAAKLCERGFITFSPQNPYIFTDRFRTLQRKAQPLGKSLFSLIVPQHQQIVDWLQTQPNVDPDRIAFYGLSYGGKSAMRIPALVTDYCLSICSADFNEWVLKNATTRHNFSYIWTGEYEIFEWDLGSTFNYAEMAALICPRPFMVERGHFDGVGEDDWVGYEYAKVRHLYSAQLKIGDRTEIEWFVGPHTINGQRTYSFLHKHLNWPEPITH